MHIISEAVSLWLGWTSGKCCCYYYHYYCCCVLLPSIVLFVYSTSPPPRVGRVVWEVCLSFSPAQMNIQLYNCAEETVQNSIINTYPEFFNADPSKLLDMLEVLVTMKSNPIVHRISFLSIAQGDSEPVNDYLIRLKSGARDCNFICPNCDYDLSSIYVKDQFVRGIANDTPQAD